MTPSWHRYLPLAVAALVAAAVLAGLYAVGGPGSGRAERRDEVRLDDLAWLVQFTECVARSSGGEPPETLAAFPECGGDLRLADPYTNDPYTYQKLSATAYRLCAGFERPASISRYAYGWMDGFEPSTGCVTLSVEP